MTERRRTSRRRRMVRNLYSYLNRRSFGRKGRRRDEARYDKIADWFDGNGARTDSAPGIESEPEDNE